MCCIYIGNIKNTRSICMFLHKSYAESGCNADIFHENWWKRWQMIDWQQFTSHIFPSRYKVNHIGKQGQKDRDRDRESQTDKPTDRQNKWIYASINTQKNNHFNNTWNNKHSFKWKLFKRYIHVVLSVKINICQRHNVCDQRIKFLWQTDRLRSKFGSCKRQYRTVSLNKYWLKNIRCWAWTSFVFVYKSFLFSFAWLFFEINSQWFFSTFSIIHYVLLLLLLQMRVFSWLKHVYCIRISERRSNWANWC